MEEKFEMVAKTMKGLEEVLAEELRGIGAENVEPGRRMVSFEGDLEILYKANLCCRTALRILKPFYKFKATSADSLYEQVKEYDWSTLLSIDKTFCLDSVVYSEEFTHSRFVTYRVKDAIVDWFRDRYGADKRPSIRLNDADIMINVHISGDDVTLSLDSSGESLHKRGYRVAQTEAPINEVLAAGIILMSGWRGETTFVDPMCGSGTFLIEAAMIAANINPGIYRKSFAFETWPDFDADLFDRLYNDDSNERDVTCRIIGADISPKAVAIANENIKSAGVGKYIEIEVKPISQWEEAPQPEGVLVTNPPYGERISAPDMEQLYYTIGSKLKNVFVGYHAWIIGYREEYFHCIGLAPSQKIPLLNGELECELREYIIFEGTKKSYLASGGMLKHGVEDDEDDDEYLSRKSFDRDRKKHRADDRGKRRFDDDDEPQRRRFDDRPKRRFDDDERGKRRFDERQRRRFDDDERPSRGFDDEAEERRDPENPLALKRNPRLIRQIMERSEREKAAAEGRTVAPETDERPKREFKPRGDKPFRGDRGDKPFRKDRDDKPFRKDRDDKPFRKDHDGKPFRRDRDDKPFRKDHDDKPQRGWRKK